MELLPQFVPQKVCLSCSGCCRFKEEKSPWRPRFALNEEKGLREHKASLADRIFSKETMDAGRSIKTIRCDPVFKCSFLNSEDNTCRIYAHRPFECELYPFILRRKGKKVVVCVHLLCPFIDEKLATHEFDSHVKKLEAFFGRQEVIDFIKNSPELVGDYAEYEDELKFLFKLNFKNAGT